MRRPPEIAYWLDEKPPAAVVVATALQQATLVLIWIFPTILLTRELRAPLTEASALISLSFVACGIGTLLQAMRGVGCGMLATPSVSTSHLFPAILAARSGGVPLVAGMTIVSGLFTILFAQLLLRLRALIPPEIAGVIVLIIGIGVGVAGGRTLADTPDGGPIGVEGLAVAGITLAIAIVLSVWGKGVLRWASVLFAILAGVLAAMLLGQFGITEEYRQTSLPAVALPRLLPGGFAFDLALLPAFLLASVASALKTVGVVTSLQKFNDADWVRPQPRGVVGAVTGDGLATILAGIGGAPPVNMSATNAAVQYATGVTSRRIAYATCAICLLLACFPAVAAMAAQVPAPVIAAVLLYAGALIMANGVQLAASRLLDTRRSLAIGLALAAAIAVESVPRLTEWLPAGLRPLMTAIGVGTLVALALNAVLRIGLRRRVTLVVPGGAIAHSEVDDFVTRAGASWGARREVIARLSHLVANCMDAIAVSGVARGDVTLAATFNEMHIDLRIAYDGPPLLLSDRAPTPDEMLDDEDGPARLAGYMVRRLSDGLRLRGKSGTTELLLTLDH